MKIIISGKLVNQLIKAKSVLSEIERDELKSKHRWIEDKDKCKIEIESYDDKTLIKLWEWLEKKSDGDRSLTMARNNVSGYMKDRKNPDEAIATKLENLPTLLKNYIDKSSTRKWVYWESDDSAMLPFFIEKIQYHPRQDYSPAYVSVSLEAVNANRSITSITIDSDDFRKQTSSAILESKGFFRDSDERYKQYLESTEKYIKLCQKDGLQINGWGIAKVVSGWHNNWRTIEKDGCPSKMVIDLEPDDDEYSGTKKKSAVTSYFWGKDEDDDTLYDLPLHPYLDVFELESHLNYRIHADSVDVYEYDKKVGEKIVLDSNVRELLEVLVEQAKVSFTDIISGKEGGAIILCHGRPGTGKTLTAEIYSEIMERPLYKVQSSQLGITATELEDELKTVLGRAERWGAIMLIDEADVYVHERGGDINQNAIVGVFLRLLEYYRGILFMTTNRGDTVDDAIESRLTAKIGYEVQNTDGQRKLWQILSEQNSIDLSSEINDIVKAFGGLSGRNIKNLLKLGQLLAHGRKEKLNLEILKEVKKFISS